jgi:hypothetical protein
MANSDSEGCTRTVKHEYGSEFTVDYGVSPNGSIAFTLNDNLDSTLSTFSIVVFAAFTANNNMSTLCLLGFQRYRAAAP